MHLTLLFFDFVSLSLIFQLSLENLIFSVHGIE